MQVSTDNEIESHKLNNNDISDPISELFNNINSADLFNHISDLLIFYISEYKKKFHIEINDSNKEEFGDKIDNNKFFNSIHPLKDSKKEYLSISNDIHSILANFPDLSNSQKLEFCESQRYFMKLYMKQILVQIST